MLVAGNDSRGVLFGIGRLLQELRMYREKSRQVPGHVRLPADFEITTAPQYPLRGHQFGYRPKVNSYDGWTPDIWEQYIRDLAVFGTNAYEMMPPRTDDDADSPHFPLPQIEMMAIISRDPGQVRPRRLDLVPGPGRGLHRPGDGGVRPRGVGGHLRGAAPDRRHLRARRRPRTHPAEGAVPAPREADRRSSERHHPEARDVDVAAELHRPLDGGLLRAGAGRAGVAERDRGRAPWSATTSRPSAGSCPPATRSDATPTSPTP